MLTGNINLLYQSLSKQLSKEQLITDNLRLVTYGTDASLYRLTPKLIIKIENEEQAVLVIKEANRLKVPITFRAAGTSLSGQTITDSVLVMLSTQWRGFNITDNGNCISMQPATLGNFANAELKRYDKKIGPDPASINSAMISGIAANNASGMTSGTINNIYNTLAGMRIILNDGTILDTSSGESKKNFIQKHNKLYNSLLALAEEVNRNSGLRDKINRKFSMKNTCGYSLNALIDYTDPFDIIPHLMIGSEGTLGFISEVKLRTVASYPHKATSLMLFENTHTACSAIPILSSRQVDAAEIMDRTALSSVENKPGMPTKLKQLPNEAAALLVEISAPTAEELNDKITEAQSALSGLNIIGDINFTSDVKEYTKLWDVRKGLFPSVCGSRPVGTTVIIEDVNFPVNDLADAVVDLREVLNKYGYGDAIIFGHSLAGNVHFVFHQDFSNEKEVERYKQFMDEISRLVVDKYNGSLKAEHGTGRNMAPFVKYEWGDEAYLLMQRIKELFDPYYILNPGVVLNNDDEVHLKNFKPMPKSHELIDKCIECGFCERLCPSRDVTLTPRQRIVAWREINRLQGINGNNELIDELKQAFQYYGEDTCATDGLCATACPVDIDTGKMIKDMRNWKIGGRENYVADFIATHFGTAAILTRFGLNTVNIFRRVLSNTVIDNISKGLTKASGGILPRWNKFIPKGTGGLPRKKQLSEKKVVYFPSCISRMMGTSKEYEEKKTQIQAAYELMQKAGYEIIYPKGIGELCCGMAFSSKGYFKQGDDKAEELIGALWAASEEGKHPILFDTSPCFYRIKEHLAAHHDYANINIYEPIEFSLKFLTGELEITKLNEPVAIHSTCSSTKLGLEEQLHQLASLCADEVVVPKHVNCCGFAGDRGFSYPELNASALASLKYELPEECKTGYSTSKTCEIGLSLHAGRPYKSVFYLLNKVSRKKSTP